MLQSLSPALASLPERPLLTLQGLSGSSRAYFLARLFAEQHLPLLIVTPNATQRDQLCHDLQCLLASFDTTTYEQLVLRYIHHGHGHWPESAAPEHFSQPDYAQYVYQPLWRLLQD